MFGLKNGGRGNASATKKASWVSGAVLAAATLLTSAGAAQAVTYTVNSTDPYIGFMNVSNLPADGGAYQFGNSWGTADLVATFDGSGNLTLKPNSINDPDPYWYKGGGAPGNPGNKNMDASMYVETPTGSLAGQSVTFDGTVQSNTLVAPYTSVAFIKDFAPDYSSFVSQTIPLTPGNFSITLNTINDPARHVQYGFETIGPDVWSTDAASKGQVVVSALVAPEPATLGAATAGLVMAGIRRRRRRA